jgi:hypothetical protein
MGPYTFNWNTTKVATGTHVLKARPTTSSATRRSGDGLGR